MSEFLSFGGYGFYILGSYLAAAVVIACELAALRMRIRRAKERIDQPPARKNDPGPVRKDGPRPRRKNDSQPRLKDDTQ